MRKIKLKAFVNKNIIHEIIGWYGTVTIVSAYALLSFEVISPTGLFYQLLNGTGALGIVYISFKRRLINLEF